jgi:HEXXH motif-containing protein
MTHRHQLSSSELNALASGRGGPRLVHLLRDAQLSKRLLLVRFIADAWPGERTGCDRALAVLAAAQARVPDTFADVLGYPSVGSWAAWTARRLRGSAKSEAPMDADLGYLAAVAAAAAARGGVDAELVAPVRHGGVTIPTVGRLALPLPDFTPVLVTVRNGQLALHGGECHALRWLTAEAGEAGLTVALDDLDPYRDVHHVPAADRLSGAEVAAWQDLFATGWTLLARHSPERAREIAAGLRSLVPLARPETRAARSATVRDTFGTFGLTLPESAVNFVVTLVHEFQHSKLSALLDVVPLYHAGGDETYYAPWRLDPRPIGGLLQGVYAFLGVADLWRSLRGCPPLHELATHQFADVREQVHRGLDSLDRATCLTAAGRRFAAGMRSTMDELRAVPLPAGVVRRARAAQCRNHETWLQANGRHPVNSGMSS